MPPDDPVVAPAAPVAPAPEPAESAPVAPAAVPESPASAPAVLGTVAEVVSTEVVPVAEPAAGETVEVPAESPAPVEEPKPHTDQPTLMELAGQEKPGEQPATPAETLQAQAQPRTYEPFTLPEGLTLDQTRVTDAAGTLFAVDNLPQERAQAYVDYHIAEMQRFQAQALQTQHDIFADTRREWVNQVLADPEIGGSGHQTAMTTIAQMRDLFVSSAHPTSERYQQEMQEFNDFLRVTGAGDHPAFNRFLHNVGRRFQEPSAPAITFQPPPDIGRRPNGAGTRSQVLYGTVQNGPNGQSR